MSRRRRHDRRQIGTAVVDVVKITIFDGAVVTIDMNAMTIGVGKRAVVDRGEIAIHKGRLGLFKNAQHPAGATGIRQLAMLHPGAQAPIQIEGAGKKVDTRNEQVVAVHRRKPIGDILAANLQRRRTSAATWWWREDWRWIRSVSRPLTSTPGTETPGSGDDVQSRQTESKAADRPAWQAAYI